MTHLLSLEQTPGRIRFIFRGEWVDNIDTSNDETGASIEPKSVLKLPPGDKESIEAKWITMDEVLHFEERKRHGINKPPPTLKSISDPWLRGHEPITFFGMLEFADQKDRSVPGLPVHNNIMRDDNDQKEVVGAFFGGTSFSSGIPNSPTDPLYYGKRAALLTHLKCRLLVYDETQQMFAIDDTTKMFPSSFVKEKNETLSDLVGGMIKEFSTTDNNNKKNQTGLLRVEYVKHENRREATLTVFPFVRLRTIRESAKDTIDWISVQEISDDLERKLAEAMAGIQNGKHYLNVLRDREGPIEVSELGGTDDSSIGNVGDMPVVSKENLDADGSVFLKMIRASQDSDKV